MISFDAQIRGSKTVRGRATTGARLRATMIQGASVRLDVAVVVAWILVAWLLVALLLHAGSNLSQVRVGVRVS